MFFDFRCHRVNIVFNKDHFAESGFTRCCGATTFEVAFKYSDLLQDAVLNEPRAWMATLLTEGMMLERSTPQRQELTNAPP